MSGICSEHQGHDPGCKLCNTDVRELLPDYDQKADEAERAGTRVCEFRECRFVFYRTTDCCPLCGKTQSPEPE